MNRLHLKGALKDIALEGYLDSFRKIDTDWYRRAGAGSSDSVIKVAIQQLKDGEISGAEVMALVYHDIAIHSIENAR